MENWRKNIKYGDVAKACRQAGYTRTVYEESQKIPVKKWTDGMLAINEALRSIVMERAEKLNSFQ